MDDFYETEELRETLRFLEPELRAGRFVFVDPGSIEVEKEEILASVEEPEGTSLVIRQESADRLGLEYGFKAAWIVLGVDSRLDSVGLIAAISTRLAAAGIACNVVSGLRHDHLLVPAGKGRDALAKLKSLSRKGSI